MAMMDYGAIALKNGKLISTEMFTPMIDMVGWEDTEQDTYRSEDDTKDIPLNLNNNYFAYVGDKDFTLAFYKTSLVIVRRYEDGEYFHDYECFGFSNYKWSKWEAWHKYTKITVRPKNGYYVLTWKYKDDKYKVYFGYGVDLPYYKKWHMVNYYRSPKYRLYEIKRWFKDKIYDWKYLR